MKHLLALILALSSFSIYAQQGTIRGSVISKSNGETLIGVNILVVGTDNGTITDLDGQFTIKLNPGSYDLQVSYITYETTTVKGIQVGAGEVTLLENIRLSDSNLELGEVVITAEAVRTSEAALLSMKKKSATIMDGISASKMRLTGDATAVEAAKRVTGVSIEGGKYVYIRGLGDRYSKTTLNGVDIPGLDPDKNTLQMDIFPSALIDNLVVSKNFTADLPADFTGGIMNIETKAFPEKKILSASASVSYNPDMHFNEDYLEYEGSSTDFLGFDDGQRALPNGADRANFPTPINTSDDGVVNRFVNSFDPNLGVNRARSLMDYSASFTIGDQIELKNKNASGPDYLNFNNKLGYIFSLSYKTDYKYYDDVVYGEYQRILDEDNNEMLLANSQIGEFGERSSLLGLLGGVAYKTKFSKYRLSALRLQGGESRAGRFDLFNNAEALGQSGYRAESENLEYNERSLTNLLLNGEHVLQNAGWEIDWRLSPTFSVSNDPDIRKTAFSQLANDTSFRAGDGGNPSRIWRYLDEISATAKIDIIKNYKFREGAAKLKFGASHTYKQRDYEILAFDMQFFVSQDWPNPDPEVVLEPQNIFPNTPNGIYYQSGNTSPNSNEYNSNVQLSAAYISNELNITPELKTILGLRLENFVQRHTGRDITFANGNFENGNNLDNEIVLESLDLFPSVNFIYSLNDDQNLRFAYGRTIARPSFKELSFAQIIDPFTNRIFNGAFFQYPGDWDGNLVETRINNIDLRWELFQEQGQLFSISAFYKQFADPIELVRIPTALTTAEYQPRNVGNGQLLGVELEIRKNFNFISPKLEMFSVSANVTFVESRIDMTDIEFESRLEFEKRSEDIENTRQMAGQSPYVINVGLVYDNQDAGLQSGIYYNVKGPTLFIVGAGLFPDIYNEPFHSLNFSVSKKLGEEGNTSIDFKAQNILDDQLETVYKAFEAEDQPFTTLFPGPSFSLGVSHRF